MAMPLLAQWIASLLNFIFVSTLCITAIRCRKSLKQLCTANAAVSGLSAQTIFMLKDTFLRKVYAKTQAGPINQKLTSPPASRSLPIREPRQNVQDLATYAPLEPSMPALSSPILSSRNLPSRLIQIKQKNLRKRTEAQRAEVPPSLKDMLEQYFEAMSAPGSVRMPSLYWDVFRKNIKAAIDRSGLLITNEYAKAVVSKMPRSECEHINLNSIDMSKLCEVVDFGMQMEAGQD
ncbi:hypothetical protein KC319_g35 [Hortaea werneckii]|nr:hypothetical protein KC319_g35 [Hortaea werneckii]